MTAIKRSFRKVGVGWGGGFGSKKKTISQAGARRNNTKAGFVAKKCQRAGVFNSGVSNVRGVQRRMIIIYIRKDEAEMIQL